MSFDVKLPSIVNRTDVEIAHAIDNVVTCSSLLNKDEIHIKIESGWVTAHTHRHSPMGLSK